MRRHEEEKDGEIRHERGGWWWWGGGAGRDAQVGRRGPVICSEWQFGGCVFCNAAIQV